MKMQLAKLEELFVNIQLMKLSTYKEFQILNSPNNLVNKWVKQLNKKFSKEKVQMTNKFLQEMFDDFFSYFFYVYD